MDELFGTTSCRNEILTKQTNERIDDLIGNYKLRLHKWFRYVLPLPFQTKDDQV
jgi:hypothetical protein